MCFNVGSIHLSSCDRMRLVDGVHQRSFILLGYWYFDKIYSSSSGSNIMVVVIKVVVVVVVAVIIVATVIVIVLM